MSALVTVTRETTEDGKPVNIRNFPQDLHAQLKARAALERVSLRDFIIQRLRESITEQGKKSTPRARAS